MRQKCGCVFSRGLVDLSDEFAETVSFLGAPVAFLFLAPDVGGELFQPVAAVLGHGALELIDLDASILAPRVQPLHLRIQPPPLVIQAGQAFVEQGELQAGKVAAQPFAAAPQIVDLRAQRAVPLASATKGESSST